VHWKPLGREVAIRSLEAIRDCSHIEIGVAFKRSVLRGKKINADREAVYTSLVRLWDDQLRHNNAYGIVGWMGTGPTRSTTTHNAHRALELSARRVIEDPMFHSSRRSQWTQMADIIAWSGYADLHPSRITISPGLGHADYLAARNPMGDPVELP
jgi:hypothetical protein